MAFSFGKPFTDYFFPQSDDTALTGLPSQTPAIYVFRNKPDRTAAAAGTGALHTISSWTATGTGYSFTVPAISDPDLTSETSKYDYWIAINCILTSGGETQTFVRLLQMERVKAHHTKVTVTAQDLIDYYPSVTTFADEPKLEVFITIATEELKTKLRNAGYEWALVWRPDRLSLFVKFRALALASLGQINQGGDKHKIKFDEFDKLATTFYDSVKVEYDASNKGEPTSTLQPSASWNVFIR